MYINDQELKVHRSMRTTGEIHDKVCYTLTDDSHEYT